MHLLCSDGNLYIRINMKDLRRPWPELRIPQISNSSSPPQHSANDRLWIGSVSLLEHVLTVVLHGPSSSSSTNTLTPTSRTRRNSALTSSESLTGIDRDSLTSRSFSLHSILSSMGARGRGLNGPLGTFYRRWLLTFRSFLTSLERAEMHPLT